MYVSQKVLNAQNAGAAGALIANNVPVGLPTMAGVDPSIFIPSAGITQALGAALRSAVPVEVRLQRTRRSESAQRRTTRAFTRQPRSPAARRFRTGTCP